MAHFNTLENKSAIVVTSTSAEVASADNCLPILPIFRLLHSNSVQHSAVSCLIHRRKHKTQTVTITITLQQKQRA